MFLAAPYSQPWRTFTGPASEGGLRSGRFTGLGPQAVRVRALAPGPGFRNGLNLDLHLKRLDDIIVSNNEAINQLNRFRWIR